MERERIPNLSSVAAPASGYATMPTPTKQITLASPDGYNVNAGTLAVAIDTARDLLYVPGSNSTSGSNVFTTTLSTAGANSTVTDAIAFPSPGGALYGPYSIALVGTELWTLGPQYVYDITSANTANGTVGTTITPARTINTNASNYPLGGIVYVP